MVSTARGFTLIELMMTIGLTAVIVSFAVVSLSSLVPKAELHASLWQLVADAKMQQHKAMTGVRDVQDTGFYGVYLENNRHTIFSGDQYTLNNPTNVVVDLPPTLSFTNNTLPSQSIIFAPITGDCHTCQIGQLAQVKLQDSATPDHARLTLNPYGVVQVEEFH